MYKNFNCDLLGITGRQSEVIELALTYGFRGIDIDIADLVKRCERTSFESASRFLTSSKLSIGGFEVPIDLDADDAQFASELATLNVTAETAGRVSANTAILCVPRETDRLPYHEYFDVIRKRIDQISEVFAKENVRLALTFTAVKADEEEKQFKFIQDVEGFLALVKSCKDVGFVFDSWNWFCGGGQESQIDEAGLDRVFAIRIADCVENVAGGSATNGDCLLPSSTSVIDNASYLRKFNEAGLDLPVSAMGRLPEAGNVRRDAFVGKTQDSLDKTFEEAGIPSTTRRPDMFAEPSFARASS